MKFFDISYDALFAKKENLMFISEENLKELIDFLREQGIQINVFEHYQDFYEIMFWGGGYNGDRPNDFKKLLNWLDKIIEENIGKDKNIEKIMLLSYNRDIISEEEYKNKLFDFGIQEPLQFIVWNMFWTARQSGISRDCNFFKIKKVTSNELIRNY